MTGYKVVNLASMVEELGEEYVEKHILSVFSCPQNPDVERFLKEKAILFSRQGLAGTHLVFAPYRQKLVLCGYFTIAIKMFVVKREALTSKLRERLRKFATYDEKLKQYYMSAPLLGQIGKNFANEYNQLITGDELLKIACDEVRDIQRVCGGKIVYLECEDKEKLKEFYLRNGFVEFGQRRLDRDEENISGEYLVQMMKYFKG